MTKMYDEFSEWWHILSAPEDYAEEAAFFIQQLAPIIDAKTRPSLLELGSGGGNNALYMKEHFAEVTLVDLSAGMLAESRKLNPDCEHLTGDMRTVRLGRTYDVVFIHDAIAYMLTLDDLRKAIRTAYVHCADDGMVLLVPDEVRETFAPSTEMGGHDSDDGRAMRYLEWHTDPDPSDTTCITDYVYIFKEEGKAPLIAHDQHTFGLFSQDAWLNILREVGFEASTITDDYDRVLFIGRKS